MAERPTGDSILELLQESAGNAAVAARVQRMQRPEGRCDCGGEAGADGLCAACRARATPQTLIPTQARRWLSAAHDPLEREADRAADTVLAQGEPARASRAGGVVARADATVDPMGSSCQPGGDVQLSRSADVAPGEAPPEVHEVLRSSGRPLESESRAIMEDRFGHDFGAVEVHTDGRAAASADALAAKAYTSGSHVVFAPHQYSPGTRAGRHLLAHELAHVVQQGAAPAQGNGRAAIGRRTAHPTVQRQLVDRGDDPTASTMTDAAARAMTDSQLDSAIVKAEQFLTTLGMPDLRWGVVTDNIDVLKRERARRLTQATRTTPVGDTPAEQGAKSTWEEGQEVGTLGIVSKDDGTVLHKLPDASSPAITTLPLNTRMAVDRRVKGDWYFVILDNGDFGYAPQTEINISLPDPEARLYRIEEGMSAQKIVKRFYKDFVWGKDERFYVNVLAFVNAEARRKGIVKPSLDADWSTAVTKAGMQIWIPGEAYANSLRSSISTGSLTYETWRSVRDVAAAVGEVAVGSVAFVAGILHGALQSLWDLVAGVVELIGSVGKILLSIIKLELLSDAKALWDTISKLKLSDIFDSISDWLDKGWNASGTWSRWKFRGWLIGYIAMEIVMLFFSAGLISALKWVGKSAKVAALLEKIPALARLAKRAEALKDVGALQALKGAVKGSETLAAGLKWAESVLLIPATVLKDLTLEGIQVLKQLPGWAVERFRELNSAAMRVLLGCTSPCKVNLKAIVDHLAGLATKGAAGAKRLLSVEAVLAALPADLNIGKISVYLKEYPALMKAIEAAELTEADFGKLVGFLTRADRTNPETAYRTFVRYLTYVVPSKTGGDIKLLNKIAEAMVAADKTQGAALKGSMFEAFLRVHVPTFAGKSFRRVRFKRTVGVLELATEARSSDFFIEAMGELWDFKHSAKVDLQQADDYLKILNHAQAGLPKVTSINYVFPSRAWAEANIFLFDRYGFIVRYIDEVTGALVVLH